jgi:hypothetical protein
MNFRRWNYIHIYNCEFYYYYLIMEKIYKINEQHFTFVKMGNLPALLPNATPPVRRFFSEMSKKRQRFAVLS